MGYAQERAEASTRRAAYVEKPQEIATVQASFLHMADLAPAPAQLRTRRPARRAATEFHQLTFADIDEAWR